MAARTLVLGTLTLWAALWVGFDVHFRLSGQPTITQYIQSVSAQYPAVPLSVGLVVGLILGHLFYQF